MSSILTNTSAMTALQTLKTINSDLAKTQDMISTGKKIATAKDNASIWAVSKVMGSDVAGFQAISESLSLGNSTVSVARQGAETVTDLLEQMKGRIVAAQEDAVDRTKIQTDIEALRDQIDSVVSAAQFNGQNLISNRSATAGEGEVDILSSLDRSDGGVAPASITVTKSDLGTTAAAADTAATTGAATAGAVAAGATADFYDAAGAGDGESFAITGIAGNALANEIIYNRRANETAEQTAYALAARLNFATAEAGVDVSFSVEGTTIRATNFGDTDVTIDGGDLATGGAVGAGGTIGGSLGLLQSFDVTTDQGAEAALRGVEDLIQISINAASSFGSEQRRIETQQDFVSGLTDALKTGIGALVDTNMEEASARLQALQVQQQLGVQALSIANQAPQTILSLFR